MKCGQKGREAPGLYEVPGDGMVRVAVPMAPPLLLVNAYVLIDPGGGVTILDPGPRSGEAEALWTRVLEQLGIAWSGVRSVVVTHHHPDHYGLAGWMQERSGCSVRMSERAYAEAMLMWGPGADMENELPRFMARHGLPEQLARELKAHQAGIRSQVTPQPEISLVDSARPFRMGGTDWQPVETCGHAPGHLSFYDAGRKIILCGDAVLPLISPNVSLTPGSDPAPLKSFLQGLSALGGLEVKTAYPGHREPFADFAGRTRTLLRHHEERLDAAAALLSDQPCSGYEVCGELFRGRYTGIHQLRFALSETLAHLAELERRGRARSEERCGTIVYSALK